MPDAPIEKRRILAIVFSDIVGFSAMMGEDEERTLAVVDRVNDVVRTQVEQRGGQVVKLLGDGTLSAFESAAEAVRAAVAVQREVARSDLGARLRIGIHVGDVIHRSDDVFGDGVNIAARLEPQATPGGVLVSQTVADLVRALPDLQLESRGTLSLKNIEEPVAVWAVRTGVEGPSAAPVRTTWPWIAGGAFLALAVSVVTWLALVAQDRPIPLSEPREVQLTFNQEQQGILALALSPDGETLAYADTEGLWLQTIATGARTEIAAGLKPVDLTFLPDGRGLFGKVADPERGPVWTEIGLDGSLGPTRATSCTTAALADDGRVACRVEDALLVLDGETEVRIDAVTSTGRGTLAWSPDGSSIASLHRGDTVGSRAWIEIHALDSRSTRQVDIDGSNSTNSLAWHAPDRLVFLESTDDGHVLRALDDASIVTSAATAQDVARLQGRMIQYLRPSRDGSRVAYLKTEYNTQIWRTEPSGDLTSVLARNGLDTPRDACAPGLLFTTTGGDLYLRSASGETRPVLVDGREVVDARCVSDAVVVRIQDADETVYERVGFDGGDRRELARTEAGRRSASLSCSRERCLIARGRHGRMELAWLDPETGEQEPLSIRVPSDGTWDVSPDGRALAMVDRSQDHLVTVVDLETEARATMTAPTRLNQLVAWAPDGESFVVAGMYDGQYGYSAARFDRDGQSTNVYRSTERWIASVVPDSDGSIYLGLREFVPNVWMLDFRGPAD